MLVSSTYLFINLSLNYKKEVKKEEKEWTERIKNNK